MQSKLLRRAGAGRWLSLAAGRHATVATAREPFTKAELKAMDEKLTASAKRGYDMWYGARADMANNGLACANCHPDARGHQPADLPEVHAAVRQGDGVPGHGELVHREPAGAARRST